MFCYYILLLDLEILPESEWCQYYVMVYWCTSLRNGTLVSPVGDIILVARREELLHGNLQMLQIRAAPADPIVSHLPAPSILCVGNKTEQPSSKCYAMLCIFFLLWLHSVEFQTWNTFVILLNLGRSVASDPEPRKDPIPSWVQGAENFPSNRKEKHGDRLSRGEWFWTRKRGTQPGIVGIIRWNAERILEKPH